ncbi:MAG: phosphoesterase [Clostridiales bacterium]|jgi:PHP family Zn ribbon phosphoesterase|nr:phosphoesterase [Clostridiales bacterium]
MQAAVDLHIHTALSPCSDKEMTPNNIARMAALKGLDFIAITDHNTMENYAAVSQCSEPLGVIAVPGMEVETREEVHLLCLFPGVEQALRMNKIISTSLTQVDNKEEIFGQQVLMDSSDKITGYKKQLLLTASALGTEDVLSLVNSLEGVVIPAHIDRSSYSIISNLGFIPDNLKLNYLELSKECKLSEFLNKNKDIAGYRFLKSSDAHKLEDILERECFLEVHEKSIKSLIRSLRLY